MRTGAASIEYERFRAARRFPGLDGLRALSILMVLTSHLHDPLWSAFNGALGVTIFFGISGFLITTLLLREEDLCGRVSLRNFYIRRVFRIAPLYFLALGLAAILVLGFDQGEGGSNFLERLPLLGTFNGEFAGTGTFSHSWSLGVEEKFYILWPLLVFGFPFVRRRIGQILVAVVPLTAIASFVPWAGYVGIYMPILGGCALALSMHYWRSFAVVYRFANPWISSALFLGMLSFTIIESSQPLQDESKYAHVLFGVLVLLAMPGVLIRNGWQQRLFSARPLVYYGNLAYAIYLFHPFVGEVIDSVLPPGQTSVVPVLARFVALMLGSFALAWVLRLTVEKPMIRVGRMLTATRVGTMPEPGKVDPDPVPARPPLDRS